MHNYIATIVVILTVYKSISSCILLLYIDNIPNDKLMITTTTIYLCPFIKKNSASEDIVTKTDSDSNMHIWCAKEFQ